MSEMKANSPALLAGFCERLLHKAAENRGLDSLLHEAQITLLNPVVMVDASWQIMASSNPELAEDLIPVWRRCVARDPRCENARSAAAKPAAFRRKPFELDGGNGRRIIAANLYRVNGHHAGYIITSDLKRPFEDDMEYIEALSKIVSMELSKAAFYRSGTGYQQAAFMIDLLANNLNQEEIENRLRALHWTPKSKMRVGIIPMEWRKTDNAERFKVCSHLSEMAGGMITRGHKSGVDILMSYDDDFNEDSKIYKELREYLEEMQLTLCVGCEFDDFQYVQVSLRQAEKAFQLVGNFFVGGPIHRYDDYVFGHIASLCMSESDDDIIHPFVYKLIRHDRRHNTSLFETLYVYLMCGKDLAQAREKLHIHRNTLFYRLAQIRELADVDLDDAQICMQIQMSARILEYLSQKDEKGGVV